MDKRIMKTRKGLKNALLCLLDDHPFEEITVTEICEQARTGRLTFYKYYSDKNELMRDCFQDLQEEIMDRMRKEGENSRGRLPQISEDSGTGLTPRLNCLLCWMETFTDVVIDVLGGHSFLTAKMIGNSGMMYELYQFLIKCYNLSYKFTQEKAFSQLFFTFSGTDHKLDVYVLNGVAFELSAAKMLLHYGR